MAIGDLTDIFNRMKRYLVSWFSTSNTPNLDALLQAYAYTGNYAYQLSQYAQLQTRLKTATGQFLDLAAEDYFGSALPRRPNESDDAYRTRILLNIIRERATRYAIIKILVDLTGRVPIVFEPGRLQDVGAWDTYTFAWDAAGAWGGNVDYTCFVTAYRPKGQGVSGIGGYDTYYGGYDNSPRFAYIGVNQGQDVTDADIYAAVESVRMEGTKIWVRILS